MKHISYNTYKLNGFLNSEELDQGGNIFILLHVDKLVDTTNDLQF